jgi:exopolyphosphatase/guanosine-5'-triphosphate,3'-diphosphate pyrophosphatase
VVDIGAASTGLILGRGPDIERVESFSVGTVKQSLAFFADGRIDARSFGHAVLSARSHFEDAAPAFRQHDWSAACASSGTLRTLAGIIGGNRPGDARLTLPGLHALRERFIGFGHVSRIGMPGLRPDRAGAIVGGLAILTGLMEELGIGELAAVEAGLRMGVMWDLHQRALQRDRRDESVRMLARRFHVDEARAASVAGAAAAVFDQLKPAGDSMARLLYWSAWMHEVGLAVAQTGSHKHAAYMVEHADLPGFTAREQKTMSLLLLAQKGNLRKLGGALADADLAKAVLALRLAVLLMHARIEPAPGQLRLRMTNRIEIEAGRDWLALHPTISYWIEKEQEWWDEAGIDLTLRRGLRAPG